MTVFSSASAGIVTLAVAVALPFVNVKVKESPAQYKSSRVSTLLEDEDVLPPESCVDSVISTSVRSLPSQSVKVNSTGM